MSSKIKYTQSTDLKCNQEYILTVRRSLDKQFRLYVPFFDMSDKHLWMGLENAIIFFLKGRCELFITLNSVDGLIFSEEIYNKRSFIMHSPKARFKIPATHRKYLTAPSKVDIDIFESFLCIVNSEDNSSV